jgi:hypothetical protein
MPQQKYGKFFGMVKSGMLRKRRAAAARAESTRRRIRYAMTRMTKRTLARELVMAWDHIVENADRQDAMERQTLRHLGFLEARMNRQMQELEARMSVQLEQLRRNQMEYIDRLNDYVYDGMAMLFTRQLDLEEQIANLG